MAGQPITAAAEIAPRGGLGGAVGLGVFVPETDELDPDGRWIGPGGYVLEGEPCPDPAAYTASLDFCAPARTWGPGRRFRASLAEQHPFLVGTAVECSTLGSPADVVARFGDQARRALELAQWPQIANELWTGQRSQIEGWANRRLAHPDATVLSATPVGIIEAIAALEDAFGACSAGDTQLIHVPRKLVAYLDAAGIIESTPGSGRIFTANGSLVIADRGYPGTSPGGEEPAAGTAWIYSTGILSARLGAIRIPERDLADAVSAPTNDVAIRAERPAAIAWLCCHLAVPVCYSGGCS